MDNICYTCRDCEFFASDNRFLNELGEAVTQNYCANEISERSFTTITGEQSVCDTAKPNKGKVVLPYMEEVVISSVMMNKDGLVYGHIVRRPDGEHTGWLLNKPCKLEKLESDHLYEGFLTSPIYDRVVTWLRNNIIEKWIKEHKIEKI